jgi:hypothetical protein
MAAGGTMMSPEAKADAMKWSCALLLVTTMLGATFAVGQAQDKEVFAAYKYRVVQVPANVVDTEYNTSGSARKPSMRPIHPLDELGAEGWELVTVVRGGSAKIHVSAGADAEGGDYLCFLRKRVSDRPSGSR